MDSDYVVLQVETEKLQVEAKAEKQSETVTIKEWKSEKQKTRYWQWSVGTLLFSAFFLVFCFVQYLKTLDRLLLVLTVASGVGVLLGFIGTLKFVRYAK